MERPQMKAIDEKIRSASQLFPEIAVIEEKACVLLRSP